MTPVLSNLGAVFPGLALGRTLLFLAAVVLSFVAMGGLFALERRGRLRAALLGAIGLVLAVQAGLGVLSASGAVPSLWVLGPLLFVFFCGFNALEASQPSLVSRMAPPQVRGAALGSYNTLQYLALKTSTPINVTLVAGSSPLFMLLVGRLAFNQPVRRAPALGALLSLAQHSANRLSVIGYDMCPITVPETCGPAMPAAFARNPPEIMLCLTLKKSAPCRSVARPIEIGHTSPSIASSGRRCRAPRSRSLKTA